MLRAVNGTQVKIFDARQERSYAGRGWLITGPVPCRQCYGCRMRKTLDWSMRNMHQLSSSQNVGAFITLTYNEDNLPENGSLDPDHLKDFWKRLRDAIAPLKIRYFACGEYGDVTNRPHYHAIIFGYDFPDKTLWSTNKGNKYYRSTLLEKKWGLGNCIIGDVNFQTCSYVAKYIQKKITGDAAVDAYVDERTGEVLVPPFQRQSLKPAIGLDWFNENWKHVFPIDRLVHEGKEFPVPQYYVDQLEKINPELYEKVKESRVDARRFRDTALTIDRLAYIENVKILQMEKRILDAEILI